MNSSKSMISINSPIHHESHHTFPYKAKLLELESIQSQQSQSPNSLFWSPTTAASTADSLSLQSLTTGTIWSSGTHSSVIIPTSTTPLPLTLVDIAGGQNETRSVLDSISIPSSFTVIEILWIVLFSIMLSVAVFGNIIVIWIVMAHRRMRTVTNYFLLNLSVADLTMATLNGAPNFVYMLRNDWIFGSILCMVNNFVANFTVASCVFTMTAISIDRWLAIIRPLEPRMTKGSAWKAICAIWLCSALLASPCLMYSQTVMYGRGAVHCMVIWPDGKPPNESVIDFGYTICLLIVTYVIPMTAMAVCYGSMSWELWGQRQIGEITQRQINSMISKRKVVRMFIVVVTTFAICWLPYHAYFIYTYHDGGIVYKAWVQHLYLSFYFLAMSTSMINPIVYYFMNTRFRNYIQEVVCNFFFCHRSEGQRRRHFLAETPPLFRRYSQSCSHSRSGTGDENHLNQFPKTLAMNTHMYYYNHPMVNRTSSHNPNNQIQINAQGANSSRSHVKRFKGPHVPGAQLHLHLNHPLNPKTCNTYC